MLSNQEYEKIHWQLNNIPNTFTQQQQQEFQRTLRKKLKEHKYASSYPPFEPSPYELILINRTTTEHTLMELICVFANSKLFTLDTECSPIPHQPNKPSLIQIQAIQSEHLSVMVFVEVCHLPHPDQPQFTLIKMLFHTLFQPGKKIYIWGEINELCKFTEFQLFTSDQIHLSRNINLQTKFKKYWCDNYPHQSTTSNITSTCKCKTCFGISHDSSLALQDAVAFQLNRWIDKKLTRQPFDIGLDPGLQHLNNKQIQYRQTLCTYAANDCDAIYQLIISTNIINEQDERNIILSSQINLPSSNPKNKSTTDNLLQHLLDSDNEERSSDEEIMFSQLTPSIERLENNKILNINNQEQLISTSTCENSNWKIISTNDNQSTNQQHIRLEPEHQRTPEDKTNKLSAEERKRIHNRSCTIKQRRRYYTNEIIIKNFDDRFTIRAIKGILRYKNISFFAVNKIILKYTNEPALAIGIRDETKLSLYKMELKHLFTSSHFQQFQRMQRQFRFRYRNNHHNPVHQRRH